jgi:arsenate reductase
MAGTLHHVLFLCTGNSARSVLAEAALSRYGAGRFASFSAGSFPKGQVHPMTIAVLTELGYDPHPFRSKSWDEFTRPEAPRLDFIFTVCDNAAGEMCPIWPGQPVTAHWGVPDPAAFVGSEPETKAAFLSAYAALEARIRRFVVLPVESMDRAALGAALGEIGERSD